MSILAIDPGYDRCGVAVLQRTNGKDEVLFSDCIETNKKDSSEVRLAHVYSVLHEVWHTHMPTTLALEQLFFSKNQKTALRVAEARGVILAIAGTHHTPVFEYSPGQIKVAVTGYGAADKKQVSSMVPRLVRLEKKIAHDDEYDAIAIGITHLAHLR